MKIKSQLVTFSILILFVCLISYNFQACRFSEKFEVVDTLAKYKDEIKWQLYLIHYNSYCSNLDNKDQVTNYIPSLEITFESINQYDSAYWKSRNLLQYLNPSSDTLIFKPRFIMNNSFCIKCTDGIAGDNYMPFSVLFIKSKNRILEVHTFRDDGNIYSYDQEKESIDKFLPSIIDTLKTHSKILNKWLFNELKKRKQLN